MKKGNYYKFIYKGSMFISQFMGREEGYSCCVCGKGKNTYCFNVFNTLVEYKKDMYETFSFGKEHLPKLIEITEKELNK